MKLAHITKDNLEECIKLYMDTFSKEPWNDVFESTDKVRAYFLNFMENNQYIGYVGIVDGEIKAISVGMIKPYIEGLEYYIDEFCVSYSSQGQGLGSTFLSLIEEDIKKRGLTAIILLTSHDVPAYQFYQKNQFTVDENLRVLYRQMRGREFLMPKIPVLPEETGNS